MEHFATFVADPDRIFLVVPYINHPITWYGVLFAFGFLVGYFLVRKIFFEQLLHHRKQIEPSYQVATLLTDRLAAILVIATVIGARLGHVFFYDWTIYRARPWDIVKVWEGGLASHGAAIGILLGILLFVLLYRKKYNVITFLSTVDAVVVAAAFAGGCIRIGNFLNQEILGRPTILPWGVIFMHPMGGPRGVALHPVQLYESFFYFFVFLLLWFVWKRGGKEIGSGLLTGIFFLLVFSFRFCIEFVKQPLGQWVEGESLLSTGQWLSLPFIFLGVAFILLRNRNFSHN